MIDEGSRLQAALAKAEHDLADAERIRQPQGYGQALSPADDPQTYIDTLRERRDVRKKLFDDWQLKNKPSAIPSSTFPTALTQEQRAKQGTPPADAIK
jgi:hypothetical protein